MPVLTPTLFFDVAQQVLDCVCVSLDAESSCGCPCRTCVVVGQPVWDECCEGQLTIFLERIYPHGNFPVQDSTANMCAAPLAGDFTVQLLRCAPTVKDDGSSPTCEELSAASLQIYSDMYIAIRAVACCLASSRRHRKFSLRDSRNIGPQGGCHGFEIRFTVELPDPSPIV